MNLTKHPLTEFERRLVGIADDRGYELTHLVKKVCELSHSRSCVPIYLVRAYALRQVIEVRIHPETPETVLEAIEAIHGLSINSEFRYHSNLRRFPRRRNKGVAEIPFARAVGCADITAFDCLLQTLAAAC
ncbi:hypothetical protein [Nonomuraea lactucae]|uniref:hypothetical protein n=1 Tax=Nonomuraea lactucae TaxID=2249762 RepID=UPI000DE226D5|nr:hypothetical protein [Nonomuraea lactucae]